MAQALAESVSVAQLLERLCKTEDTWRNYTGAVEGFIEYRNVDSWADLLQGEPKVIEDSIIAYFQKLEDDGLSPSYKNVIRAGLQKFYVSQRARLDWDYIKSQIVSKNPDSVGLDRAYTKAEIALLLKHADLKLRATILLLATTGMRVEALCELKYKHLRPVLKFDLLYIKIYAGTNTEYDAFASKNCLAAVRAWLQSLKEEIGRELSDEDYIFPGNETGEHITKKAIESAIVRLIKKAGIAREKISKRRYDIAPCHSFRKYFSSTLESTHMPHGLKEALMGHFSGVQGRYRRPPIQKLLMAYVEYGGVLDIQ
ncbi:site-specific recombinase XerD [Candidatus Nitrososphaera evergladensis SR1]|uniref:Site-specific recombinase XerD n=1 Tax=Candidatus Nitrososphaera evergladensis SR1 TaxID=1459636 RepID=A0A075MR12_9ARCH|nr:site-specific integrase [Candidatus Nitrososphaera evergladensis]AIF83252.1 site-specific recombinase XerD [Candidatus Nitrososphaera evergladensis SR1]